MNRRRFLQVAGAGVAGLALPSLEGTREGTREGVRVQGAKLAHAQDNSSGTELVVGQQAMVAIDALNVRGGPGADEPLVGTLLSGDAVDLLARDSGSGWWRVAGAQIGYVDGQYLQATGAPAASQAFDLDLIVPYSPQLTPVWCDPADIEMWLGYHQIAGGQTLTDAPSRDRQQAIWNWETDHNAGFTVDQWDCSPYAVASAASQWMPTLGFDHFRYDDSMEGTRLLAWLLAHPDYHEPSIATIWAGAHYVLVRGVRATSDPSLDPAGSRILGFYIADPNRGSAAWYGQDRFIPLDKWLSELFTPISFVTPHTGVPGDLWQNQYVAIQRTKTSSGPSDAGVLNATAATYPIATQRESGTVRLPAGKRSRSATVLGDGV